MKCCICGTVKNCEKYLQKCFENMEKIGRLFEDYRIVLYYDHSTDNTLNILKSYQQRNNRLFFYVNQEKLTPYRTVNIAKGRNYCLGIMRKYMQDYEYFIMMDCDDVCAYNINRNLLKAYLTRDDWDALSFQHPMGYYDLWALSKRPLVLSCHHFENPLLWNTLITREIDKLKQNGNHHQLIPCYSAFNGFAIYRKDKFINCYYDGMFRYDYVPNNLIAETIKYAGRMKTKNGSKEDCEHRHFHFQAVLKNNAKIRISPLSIFVGGA